MTISIRSSLRSLLAHGKLFEKLPSESKRLNPLLVQIPHAMAETTVATGVVHNVPADLREAMLAHADVLEKWNSLTPLARNEWICWVTIVKKPETRKEHIDRLCEQLLEGKRRPCCWPGCPHRNPKAKKWFT